MSQSSSNDHAVRLRRVATRTRGHRQGPVTRLMSPSDLGQTLRPFVFLDLIDLTGTTPHGVHLHPHSGIATLTWILEGNVGFEDTLGRSGTIPQGGVEWMQAGGGAWHGGDFGDADRVRGFQLWVALPPDMELGGPESIYLEPGDIERDGPVTVLLGRYGRARSPLQTPSPINYLSVKLKAGEHWRYEPPEGHAVGWAAVSVGELLVPDKVQAGELVVFDESEGAIEFHAETDAEFVFGSAVKHPHDLVLGYYSVHTSATALEEGEARIREIGIRLREQGRLR
ncbi:pirin family protein [Paraburkholderia elongata]|jgi:redox-sensitive bicupin YhaK (pirin superfamily)|uniref:Pirin family protein n=1 Tax=Paraburkholderia elongata TaxID=2675747 RepID=A0A972NRL9_9BURK|nr:pirin family protein [Paraburkholderia elongata]NPT56390.1 pirin family protein [Paraburkholderia elongata]